MAAASALLATAESAAQQQTVCSISIDEQETGLVIGISSLAHIELSWEPPTPEQMQANRFEEMTSADTPQPVHDTPDHRVQQF